MLRKIAFLGALALASPALATNISGRSIPDVILNDPDTGLPSSKKGTPTQSTVMVGTSSGLVLAASAASNFIKLCVASTAANGVWIRWDGGTATQAAPSEYIPPGQCDAWVKQTGFLPSSQINGIASSSVAVSLIYN